MPEFVPPFATLALRWMDAVASNPQHASIGDLVRAGCELFSLDPEDRRETGTASSETVGAGRPIHVQLIDRIRHRATIDTQSGGYRTRSELVDDIAFLVDQFSGPTSRRHVLKRLADAVDDSRRGYGGATLVVGGSGFGKTFLWKTIDEQIFASGDMSAYHKSPQSGTMPYGSVAYLLDALLIRLAARRGESAERLLARIMDTPGSHEVARGVLPSILTSAGLLDHQSPVPGVDYTEALAALIRALASRVGAGAVTVVADDIQWADEPSVAVLRRLAEQPGNIALIAIGRNEALDRVVPESRFEVVHLPRLTNVESQRLLDFMVDRYADESERTLLSEWVATRADGIPLNVVNMVRTSRQTRVLGHRKRADPPIAGVLGHHLDRLSRPARYLVQRIALLFPPVALSLVREIPEDDETVVDDLLQEAEKALLISVDREKGLVSFQHDSIETSARQSALESTTMVDETADLLWRLFESGDDRAAFSIARMLTSAAGTPSAHDAEASISTALVRRLGVEAALRVLGRAAERAVALLIPDEASAFALGGLALSADSEEPHLRLPFHTIAHHAAFLLDDVPTMSRHFTQIKAHADRTGRNEARNLWVERCYANLWIRGAVQIGLIILAELRSSTESDGRPNEWSEADRRRARAFFRRWSPRSLFRELLRKPIVADRRSELLVRTCVNMMLATMTLATDQAGTLAWIILDDALTHGRGTLTGMGFLMWSAYEAYVHGSIRRRRRLGAYAKALATDSLETHGDVRAHHTIHAYAAILTDHLSENLRTTTANLRALGEEGIRIGGYEEAAHSVSVYGQNLFFCGEPLDRVFETINTYRARVTALGHRRTATSMAKYQQAVECLMHKTVDPSTLTGNVCDEPTIIAELTAAEDVLSLDGLYIAKGFNATYDDDPESAFAFLEPIANRPGMLYSLFVISVTLFLFGLAAWRLGRSNEGKLALGRIRRLARSAPGNAHRVYALRAEQSRYTHRPRRAAHLYAKAAREAIAAGYANEAAFIHERHGTLLRETGGDEEAMREAFQSALNLYETWGAAVAIDRVRERLRDVGGGAPSAAIGTRALRTTSTKTSEREPLMEALSEAKRELANTQDSVQLLFAMITDALLLVDSQARVLFFNPAAQAFLNTTSSEEARLDELIAVRVRSMFDRALETRSSVEEETQWRDMIVRITVNTAPTRDGSLVAALVIRDVTEHREREERLIVTDRLSLLGILASSIAHEVGNPNHIVQLNGQSLEILLSRIRNANDPPDEMLTRTLAQASEILSGIMEGARRIDGVIQQVKEYGHQPTGDGPSPVDPAEICERVVRFTRIMVKQYSTELRYELRGTVPQVRAETGLIEQALINLIKNGCEALGESGGRVSLRLFHDDADLFLGERGAVCFAVCDQGPGIPAEVAGRITGMADAHFSGQSSKREGAGMGLSIVRTIVRRHNGTIGFTRDSEYNTITEIRLPAV